MVQNCPKMMHWRNKVICSLTPLINWSISKQTLEILFQTEGRHILKLSLIFGQILPIFAQSIASRRSYTRFSRCKGSFWAILCRKGPLLSSLICSAAFCSLAHLLCNAPLTPLTPLLTLLTLLTHSLTCGDVWFHTVHTAEVSTLLAPLAPHSN